MSWNLATMIFLRVALLAVQLAHLADAQIPKPCAGIDEMTARKCCPTPTVFGETDPGPCGVNIGRGSCQSIANLDSGFAEDVRENWPFNYFNMTCVCAEQYGGYDCGGCSFAYIGDDCSQKVVRERKPITELTDEEWTDYLNAIAKAKNSKSNYMVVTREFTENVTELIDSMVNPTHYDMFVWLHHFVAKDIVVGLNDYAHVGTGFPTWHRLYLLWFEREIQIETGDPMFSLHYWDWRDPEQREALFTKERLGENINGTVTGSLFEDWKTYCWQDVTPLRRSGISPVPICDPTMPSNETLRRCPIDALCKKEGPNWPTYDDVKDVVSVQTYDAVPYDTRVLGSDTSFRNRMEGILAEPGVDCGNHTMCFVIFNVAIVVKQQIHNSVHNMLGVGDFTTNLPFNRTGVMGDTAASPNDPIFLNHHAMVDCILEAWLQQNPEARYPESDLIRNGHRASDYIVPFIPLYTHNQMFKTADNLGYSCTLSQVDFDSSAALQISVAPFLAALIVAALTVKV